MTEDDHGRVAEDGTVYVRRPGRRRKSPSGQWAAGSPEEGLDVLPAPLRRTCARRPTCCSPGSRRAAAATTSVTIVAGKLRDAVAEPHLVGDLAALSALADRLEAAGALRRRGRRRGQGGRPRRDAGGPHGDRRRGRVAGRLHPVEDHGRAVQGAAGAVDRACRAGTARAGSPSRSSGSGSAAPARRSTRPVGPTSPSSTPPARRRSRPRRRSSPRPRSWPRAPTGPTRRAPIAGSWTPGRRPRGRAAPTRTSCGRASGPLRTRSSRPQRCSGRARRRPAREPARQGGPGRGGRGAASDHATWQPPAPRCAPSASGGTPSVTCPGATGTRSRAGCAASRRPRGGSRTTSGGGPTRPSGRWPSPP